MKGKYIKSIKEFEKKYFPKSYKKKINAQMPPEKIAVLWAKDTVNKLKKNLKLLP